MSTIAQLMAIGTNVQLVVTLADLKELFLEWQAEVEANKVKEKEETYKTVEEAAAILHRDRSSLWSLLAFCFDIAKLRRYKSVCKKRKVGTSWIQLLPTHANQKQ